VLPVFNQHNPCLIFAILSIDYSDNNAVEPLASRQEFLSKNDVALQQQAILFSVRAFLRDFRLFLFNLDSAVLGRIRDTSGGGERLKEIGECSF